MSRASRTTGALVAAFVVSQANIARLLEPLGGDVARVQTTVDPDELREVFQSWSPEQRVQYRKHLLPDTLHPLIYGAALVAAGEALRTPGTPGWMRVAGVAAPVLAAGCDLAENAFHARFIHRPDEITDRAASASAIFTRTKWVLALGTLGALLARAVSARLRRR